MKRKILLVDDDASLLAMLGDFLESEGYDVVKAASGEDALSALRGYSPDLVILDMMMPGMGGVGFLERIIRPDGSFRFPVLVMTAKSMMAEYFADKQIDGFIAKPCDPEDLALEVSRIIFQTSGQQSTQAYGIKPLLYVADADLVRRAELDAELSRAGYDVSVFSDASSLIEAAVQHPPAFVAMGFSLPDQNAAVVADLLCNMKALASVKILIYGAAAPTHDDAKRRVITEETPQSIIAALGKFIVSGI